MTFRPWLIAGLMSVAVIVHVVLLYQERIPSTSATPEVRKLEEKLRTLQYLPSNRRANFQTMGMELDMAEASASHISRFQRQEEKFIRLMDEQAAELVEAFCPTTQLPQPFAALQYLVYEENRIRYVVDPLTMKRFEAQPWYTASLVPALYDHFERTDRRKSEATLMAVSAVLLDREVEALDGRNPWSLGVLGGWGFGRLVKQDARVKALAIEYFALMHFLTELANARKGICS